MHVLGLEEIGALLVPGGEIVAAGKTQRLAQEGDHLDVLAVHAQHRAVDRRRRARRRVEQRIVDLGEALRQSGGALVHEVELVRRHAEALRALGQRLHVQVAGDAEVQAEVDAALRLGPRAIRVEGGAEIGGPVERQHRGHAAQRRRARLGQEVGLRRAEAEVHVRVDDARHDPAPGAVDHLLGRQGRVRRQDRRDAAVLDADAARDRAEVRQHEQPVAQQQVELHAECSSAGAREVLHHRGQHPAVHEDARARTPCGCRPSRQSAASRRRARPPRSPACPSARRRASPAARAARCP